MFALDLLNQFQSYNGTLLAAGKIYVYHLGRTHLAPVYGDHNGATVLPNPVILDDQGMAEIYLNDAFNYTVVVCDAYGAEQFSRDVYPKGMGNGESIGTQLYEGIDPIVVNNDVYAISANTSRLGVVTPLYFVKDDEEETIIGFSGEAIIPSGTMNESAIGYEDGKITSYNGSAFSAGLNYSAGDNIVINGATIALDSAINLLDEQGAKAVSIDATEQQFTNLTSNNGSILDASGLYVSDLNMENAANLSKDGLYVTGTGSRISMSNDMSDIYGDNHFEIYGYQESGDGISAMHLGGNDLIVQHGENHTITASYSLTGACSSAQSALDIINSSDLTQYSAGANIDITDHVISGKDWSNEINDASANAYNQSTGWTDSQGYLTGVDLSEYAKTDFVVSSIDAATSGKYDTSSFSAISGSFLTAHQSLPQSADWNEATTVVNNNSAIWNNTTNVVSSNSAQWGATNPQIPITGINGIKISESGDKVVFEVSGDYATKDWVTGQGYLTAETDWTNTITGASAYAYEQATAAIPAPFDPTYISGQIDSKLDSATYATDSGNFATTGDLNDLVTSIAETYQPTAGMTAYQSAGDYYSASNPSGFITGVDLSPYQTTAGMTAYANSADVTGTAQYGLTTAGWTEITGGGGVVSGTNVVFEPGYWGAPYGNFYSATISGDVIVTTGDYDNNGAEILPRVSYSLSSIGADIGNKLNKNTIERSNTIAIIGSRAEVTDRAYRGTGFSNISAYHVNVYSQQVYIDFMSGPGTNLYSAIVIVETTASGEYIPDDWSLVSYENNSATFARYYPLYKDSDMFILYDYEGWGDFTNAEASATVYSALEIAPLAFKDDITGITYTTGSI